MSLHPPGIAPYRPMKPVKDSITDFNSIDWSQGYWASPKIDGIRCVLGPQGPITTTGRPVNNPAVKEFLAGAPEGLDGELISFGDWCSDTTYSNAQSCIMSKKHNPDFTFAVFDTVFGRDASSRIEYLESIRPQLETTHPHINILDQQYLTTAEQAQRYYNNQVLLGYEGACYRRSRALYKNGRATASVGELFRAKKIEFSEAVILSVAPVFHNLNTQTRNSWDLAERSSAADGKAAGEYLGSLWARDLVSGVTFSCGTFDGLTIAQRTTLWENRASLLGKVFRYSSHAHGVKDAPRQPVFAGFRDPSDLDLTY